MYYIIPINKKKERKGEIFFFFFGMILLLIYMCLCLVIKMNCMYTWWVDCSMSYVNCFLIVPSCCWRGFARHSLLSNPIDLLIKYLKWKHHNIFVENMSQGNTRWKIVSCDRTFTVVQLHIQQPAILNHWTSSSKNVHIISMATARKNRDLIADWCVMP
jgi:hypothetical protein